MKNLCFVLVCCITGVLNLSAQDLEIYVSSRFENAIKQYDQDGNYIRDLVSANSGGLSRPQDIIFLEDNTVIVSGIQNTAIKQYDAGNGDFIGNFTSGFSLNQPTRMVIKDDLLYVTQWANTNNKVIRFDLNGNFVDEFTSIGIPQSIGIDWDTAGNLYISTFGQGTNGFVQKFDTSGNDMGVFIDSSILQGPTNIWFDENQNLLVEDWSLGIVRRFSSTGQYIDDFITGMTNPEGISFLPNGDVLICDWGTDTVERFDSDGNSLGTFISGNNLADPNAVVLRETILSVSDHLKSEVFVVPTVGNRFSFSSTIISNFESLQLYDVYGRLVQILDPNENSVWDASNLSEGVYFISAFNTRIKATQKIIIEN